MAKKNKRKKIIAYFKGFWRGFKILLVYFGLMLAVYLVMAIILVMGGQSFDQAYQILFEERVVQLRLVSWLIGLLCVGYLIKKYHLMKGWILLGLIISIYAVPFMLGVAELEKDKKVN